VRRYLSDASCLSRVIANCSCTTSMRYLGGGSDRPLCRGKIGCHLECLLVALVAVIDSWANAWAAPVLFVGDSTSKAINDSTSDVANGSFGFAVNASEAYSDNGGSACAHNGEVVDDAAGLGTAVPEQVAAEGGKSISHRYGQLSVG
jgi:hypothetical protein